MRSRGSRCIRSFTNIQTSWVKMGPDGVKRCLRAGANDLGGTLMDETITRAAGAAHGQEMTPAAMEAIIRSIGRIPRQRDTLYSDVPDERYRASFAASRRASWQPRRHSATVSTRDMSVMARPKILLFQ